MSDYLIILHRDNFLIEQFEVHNVSSNVAEMIAISYIEYNEMEVTFDIYIIV